LLPQHLREQLALENLTKSFRGHLYRAQHRARVRNLRRKAQAAISLQERFDPNTKSEIMKYAFK